MNEAVFQAASVALLGVCLQLCGYLKSHLGFRKGWVPIDSKLFLIAVAEVFFFTALGLIFLGPERIVCSLAIGLGLLLTLLNPVSGICFLSSALLIRPWELTVPDDFLTALPRLLAVLCALSFLVSKLRAGSWFIYFPRPAQVIALFVVWLIISAVIPQLMFGQDAVEALKQLFSFMMPPLVVALLLVNCAVNERDIEAVKDTVFISITGFAMVCLIYSVSKGSFSSSLLSSRLEGPGQWGNSNDLAALIVFVLPLAFACFSRSAGSGKKILSLLALVFLAIMLFLTQSRGALMGAALAAVTWFFSRGKGLAKGFFMILILMCALLLLKVIIQQRSDAEESRMSRMNYALAGAKMIKSSPVFGVGFGNYEKLYGAFSELFIEEGQRTAHSSWVLVAAETGLPGLALFVLIFVMVFRRAWAVRKKRPEYLSVVTGYGLAMSFLSHTYLFLPYLMFALVVAGARVTDEKGENSDKESA